MMQCMASSSLDLKSTESDLETVTTARLSLLRLKAGSQYDATRAMRGVKCARERRNRLGFYSCVSCVHALRRYCEPGLRLKSPQLPELAKFFCNKKAEINGC